MTRENPMTLGTDSEERSPALDFIRGMVERVAREDPSRGERPRRLGVLLAMKALKDNGFTNVVEIKEEDRIIKSRRGEMRIAYGHLLATKGGRRYVFQVVTRRKLQRNGNLNDRYILLRKSRLKDLQGKPSPAEKQYTARPYWIAVRLEEVNDNSIYRVYLGSIHQLSGKLGIPMREVDLKAYRCLASDLSVADALEQEIGEETMSQPPEINQSIKRFRQDYRDPSKVGFVLMRFGRTTAHREILRGIEDVFKNHGITTLRADAKEYHTDLFWNVLTYIYGCSFGIAVFERIETEQFNPNVAFEVGYMMSMGKHVCLLKDKTLSSLHTDLMGKLYREFDPQHAARTIAPVLEQWAKDKGIIP